MKRVFNLAILTVFLVGLAGGCSGRDYADKLDAMGAGKNDGSADKPTDVPAASPDVTGDHPTTCGPDEHACTGACAKNDDRTACGPSCVDCTGLPNIKPDGVQCQGGKCVVPANGCAAGHAHCSSNPADICETDTTKPENCGACGQKCTAAAPLCANVAGVPACVLSCSATTPDKCDTTCVDLKSDVNNCGTCGKSCSIPNGVAGCMNGTCVLSKCKDGYGDCTADPGCETQLNSASNCGACGKSCLVANGSAMCVNGTCGAVTCNAGFGNCDNNPDCETPLNTTTNCGKCGMACDANKPLCSTINGQQVCASDCTAAAPMKCGMACVDPTKDLANCGGCNMPCSFPNAAAACANSQCTQGQCKTGFGDCIPAQPGCETMLGTNANCGHCGDVCGTGTKCMPSVGMCVSVCNGVNCGAEMKCDMTTGQCIQKCMGVMCDPTTQRCDPNTGLCVDACTAGGDGTRAHCCTNQVCGKCQKCDPGSHTCQNEINEDIKNECTGTCQAHACDGNGGCRTTDGQSSQCMGGVSDCRSGNVCQNGACVNPPKNVGGKCGMCGACDGNGNCNEGSKTNCYIDADGDGYGAMGSTPMVMCGGGCQPGYVSKSGDCCDGDSMAYPGSQVVSSETNVCGNFDFNCDGRGAPTYPTRPDCRAGDSKIWIQGQACGQFGNICDCVNLMPVNCALGPVFCN